MEKSLVVQQEFASAQQTTAAARAAFDTELNSILDRLERAAGSNVDGSSTLGRWLGKPVGWKGSAQELSRPDARLVALLGYSFEIVSYLSNTMSDLMRQNLERDEQQHSSLLETFRAAGQSEAEREREIAAMERNDPQVVAGGDRDDDAVAIGSHLAPLSRLEAMTRVEGKFRSNNAPTSPFDRLVDASAAVKVSPRPAIYNYKDADEIAVALASMHSSIRQNASSLSALLVRKDSHYQAVKGELTEQMVEKRKREEGQLISSSCLKCPLFVSFLRGDQLVVHPQVSLGVLLEAAQAVAAREEGAGSPGPYAHHIHLRSCQQCVRCTETCPGELCEQSVRTGSQHLGTLRAQAIRGG
jgi:hypothetical protein